MPGVLLLETMAQTSGWLIIAVTKFERMPFLAAFKEAKLRNFIPPGTTLSASAKLEHEGSGLFAGLPSPLTVGRYHSLVAEPSLPDSLTVTARGGGVVMAVRHRELPALGVQFHPESVLTPDGKRMLENFLGDPD